MRAREAWTSASCASTTSLSRSACSAARRTVMSKIAPSQPAPTVTGLLGLTAFEHPAHVTVAPLDPVFQAERTAGVHGLLDRPSTCSRSSGWITLANVRAELSMKSAAGYPEISSISWLTHCIVPVRIADAAIQRAGDVGHQRPQQRLVGAQTCRAQASRHARREHLRFERYADHVIGSGVERVAQLRGESSAAPTTMWTSASSRRPRTAAVSSLAQRAPAITTGTRAIGQGA